MLERRGLVEAECLNSLYNYFSRSKLNHYIIVGNHDLLSLHTSKHALTPLRSLKNVKIIDSAQMISATMGAIPYMRNPRIFLSELEKLKEEGCQYLFCHQGIKEFTINSGYTEEEAIELNDVSDLHLVVAGHYHTPKQMGNVVYLGSPFSHSFSESNETKRLGIFDETTGTMQYIPLDIFPKHVTINLDLNSVQEKMDYNPRDFVRVIATGTQRQIEEFKAKFMTPRVKWIFNATDTVSAPIAETLSNEQKWIKWAKDIKQLGDHHVTLGLELLK